MWRRHCDNWPAVRLVMPDPEQPTWGQQQDSSEKANALLIACAPPVPSAFWGEVRFIYQAGRCTMVEITERVKA